MQRPLEAAKVISMINANWKVVDIWIEMGEAVLSPCARAFFAVLAAGEFSV